MVGRAGSVALRAGAWPLAGFVFGVICTALPLLMHLQLPLVDLPNHIARLHVATLGPEAPLSDYYRYTASWVPNAAIDLLWRGLDFPLDATRFAQLVMVSYAVNFIASAMVLARVVQGRWTLWSAAAALVVYSAPFMWGFQNFVWSLPFCLYGLALWLGAERRGLALRLAVFLPYGLMIYLMHFFAFGFLWVLVIGRELQVLIERGRWRDARGWGRFGVLMLPFIVPLVWLFVTLHAAGPAEQGTKTAYGVELVYRFEMLVAPLWADNAKDFPLLNALAIVGLLLLALVFSRLLPGRGPRLIVARPLRGAVLALALAMCAAPTWLNGVAQVHIRAPMLLCALLFAATRWEGLSPRLATTLALVFALVIGARGLAFERFAARYEAEVQDMFALTRSLPEGARLLSARAPGRMMEKRLWHIEALNVAQRDVFVAGLFQGVHALQVRKKWKAYTHPQLFPLDIRLLTSPEDGEELPEFARDWTHKFTDLLLLDPIPAQFAPLLERPDLHRVASQGRFTLYHIAP